MSGVCPDDLFERLLERIDTPYEYHNLLCKVIHDLCRRVESGGFEWVDGVPYVVDPIRGKSISVNRAVVHSARYGQNQSDRYLKIGEVTTMQNGFYVGRAGTITGLWAKSRSTTPWSIEIRKNDVPITLVNVSVVGSVGENMNVDVDVDAGDYLQFYLQGSSVDHPIAGLELAWRLT